MFGLGLSKYLPPAARRLVRRTANALHVAAVTQIEAIALQRRQRIQDRPFRGERIAVLGLISTNTGVGRAARLIFEEKRRAGAIVAAFDAKSFVHPISLEERRSTQRALEAFAPTDLILAVNPPVFDKLARHLPEPVRDKSALIAMWVWELEKLPQAWVQSSTVCDEIWGPTPFVVDAIKATLPRFPGAVRLTPYPVDIDPAPPIVPEKRSAARAKLSLAENDFVIGQSFAMGSSFTRKNPMAAIAAFQMAFPSQHDVRLLIRCYDIDVYPPGEALLRAAADNDPRLMLLGAAPDIFEFYQALDVLVSLQRSEGYGLNLAEALQAGLEVVATGWSISDDIQTRPGYHSVKSTLIPVDDPQGTYLGVSGARWAEADITDAASKLRALYDRRAYRS